MTNNGRGLLAMNTGPSPLVEEVQGSMTQWVSAPLMKL